tara:strand:+ start:195 stop:761 length:567 start_codon:yes stop_codon:yes gene_type:complete
VSVKIKIDSDATEEEVAEINAHSEHVQISIHARKTLDGKIMILEHKLIDIILDTKNQKIITFPKEELSDEIYSIQSSYFKYLVNEGVVLPDSIRSGNIFGSLEGVYPDAADENVSATQIVLYSTKKFIEAQAPHLEMQEFIENEIEEYMVDPTPEDSTELGEVPEEPKKGSITPSRIRRYLSGYGYYE